MTETFQLSLFQHKKDNKPRVVLRSWQELCERFQKPQIRKEKDGQLFSPALFEPARRLKENVKELSLLCFDVDHDADFEQTKKCFDLLDCAYAIYSTHSHLRPTDSNPNAEPRYRVVVPLACPIQADKFSSLWQYAKQQTRMPFDESAKDSSRMFYTPVKSEPNAPYQFFINDGDFLDWQVLPLDTFANGEPSFNAKNANSANQNGNGQNSNSTDFEFHEDRHAELCRRIENQGKNTGRGTFEMKCPAHNGKGISSLFYDVGSKAVKCLNKQNPCSYFEILDAFKLPNGKLGSRESAGKASNNNQIQSLRRLKTVRMSEVQAKPVEWLWQDYVPLGAFTILEGEEELGKTWIVCAVAGATAQGYGLPNNPENEPANVVMMSAEDSLPFVIKPRLEAVKAPCERIIAIEEHFTFDKDGILRLEFELAEHLPKLVIIDPLFSYTGKINLNNDNEIRSITDEIKRLAEKYGCAIIGIRHIGKSKGMGDPRNAGLNGIGWRASARVVLLVGKDPNNERQRAIVQTKNNLAPRAEKAQGYEIIGNEFFWKDSALTARTMLSVAKNDEEQTDQTQAVDFLREVLKDGECLSTEIEKEAKRFGITNYALKKARTVLGVESFKKGGNFGGEKSWYQRLPGTEEVESKPKEVDFSDIRHLQSNQSDKTSYGNDLAEEVETQRNEHHQIVQTTSSSSLVPNNRMRAVCNCGANGYVGEDCPNCKEVIIPF